jgi:hypothetical protein
MKLYLISQYANRGYDTYDGCVVTANSEEEARNIHPNDNWGRREWCSSPAEVDVQYLGEAADDLTFSGIILSSFNAG